MAGCRCQVELSSVKECWVCTVCGAPQGGKAWAAAGGGHVTEVRRTPHPPSPPPIALITNPTTWHLESQLASARVAESAHT